MTTTPSPSLIAGLAATAFALALTCAPVSAAAQTTGAGANQARPPAASTPARAYDYSFAFQDADISSVADEILGSTLGLAFTVDPAVTTKMTFRIDRRLTKAQLLEAFEAALSPYDIAMVRNGEAIALMPRSKAKNSATLRGLGDGKSSVGYEVVAVPLAYATPSEVSKALESMGSGNLVVYANDPLGLLVLGGTHKELQAVQQTLGVLDKSGLEGAKIKWFDLVNAPADVVAADLEKVLQASGVTGATIVPLKRLNGLLVLGRTPQILDEAGHWLEKLDAPSREEPNALWVYHPQNLTAESLGGTLSTLLGGDGFGGAASAAGPVSTSASPTGGPGRPPSAPTSAALSAPSAPQGPRPTGQGSESNVRVSVNKESNTILVTAPASRWIQISKILDQIDHTPGQILIEASILEVTLTDEFRFGIDWKTLGAGGRLTVTSSSDTGGTIGPTFPGFSATYVDSDIRAAVDALSSRTEVEVRSAPKLLVLDNRTAKLQIGDQVPVVTQQARDTTAANAPLVVTTEYKDTGIIMSVTPRISGANNVILEVSEEVSSVARTTTSGIDSPTVQQRKFESTLLIKDHSVVALGGLISQNASRNDGGVPFMKDIPLIGSLFKSQAHDRRRTELIVLISAKIVPDAASAEKILTEMAADLHDVESRGLLTHQ